MLDYQLTGETWDAGSSSSSLGSARVSKTGKRLTYVLGFLVVGLVAAVVVLGVKLHQSNSSAPGGGGEVPTAGQYTQAAEMVASVMNPALDPCNDFYQYACGGWLDQTSLPGDATKYARTFSEIGDRNLDILHDICEEDWPIIGDYYQSCMNTQALDMLGTAPLAPPMALIAAATDKAALFSALGSLVSSYDVQAFLSVGVATDAKQPNRSLIYANQGGLTLPLATMYVDANTTSAYARHVSTMLSFFFGTTVAAEQATADLVVAFEMAIANFTKPPSDLRDPNLTYNLDTVGAITARCPALPLAALFVAADLPYAPDTPVLLENPAFLIELGALIAVTPLSTLASYVQWRVLHAHAAALTTALREEDFRYFSTVLAGQAEPAPRWKTCAQSTSDVLSDVIGRIWVARAFAGDSKLVVQRMIGRIKKAFGEDLPNLPWMDEATQSAAYQKLSLVEDLIGYPEKWSKYEGVDIANDSFLSNVFALSAHDFTLMTVDVLSKPTDKSVWQMSPPTVNAYYEPTLNTINFPAGILQPTFFDVAHYPTVMNYGGIGMVMGHELTHGFDDQGRLFDGTGMLREWWSPEVSKSFDDRAQCLVKQYSDFAVPFRDGSSLFVDGALTLGENIADNGGIRLAYRAWQKEVSENGPQSPLGGAAEGITNEQLFFLSFAQGWCTLTSDEEQRVRLQSDVHSPPAARVILPLANFDQFAAAYSCPAGSRMNPVDQCELW